MPAIRRPDASAVDGSEELEKRPRVEAREVESFPGAELGDDRVDRNCLEGSRPRFDKLAGSSSR